MAERAGWWIRHRAPRGAVSCIAVINRSTSIDPKDIPFWAAAADKQAREVSAAWGCMYQPVVYYGTTDGLPAGCRILTIRDDIDQPGALGYHDDDLGVIHIEVKATENTSVTISHEVPEELVDPTVNLWAPFDPDHEQAIEVCDRVAGDSYPVEVTVAGETREILVSNYLLPSAFDPAGRAPFDRMGKLTTWNGMSPGGYAVVRDITTGKVSDQFVGDDGVSPGGGGVHRVRRVLAGPGAAHLLAERLAHRGSRVLRLLRG